MRTLLRFGLAVAAVTVVAVVVVAQATNEAKPAEEKRPDDQRFEVRITDEMVRHSRIRDVLYFVGIAWSGATMLALLFTGASRKMRDIAAKRAKRPYVAALIYIVLFIVATALIDFPLAYYSGFHIPHEFHLSTQSFGSWMGDVLKGLAVSLVIVPPLGALALMGIRKVKNWWIVLWAAWAPFLLFLVIIQPIVLDPIFNKFEPLQDQVLRQKLLDLASRAGIEGGRVYQVNKSKQTTTMNAYVNGIGPTNRIVMWDTLLAKMNHDEVLAVMGHEMGHYVMKHIWKGLAAAVAGSLVVFFLLQRIYEPGLRKWGGRWGFDAPGDPASVPWLLLIVGALTFLSSPFESAVSRRMEHQADMFSLELTHLNEPMAVAFRKFAEDSKRDPSPNPLIELWLYSHPPIAKRIPFALSYKPWERGEPNQMWTGR